MKLFGEPPNSVWTFDWAIGEPPKVAVQVTLGQREEEVELVVLGEASE